MQTQQTPTQQKLTQTLSRALTERINTLLHNLYSGTYENDNAPFPPPPNTLVAECESIVNEGIAQIAAQNDAQQIAECASAMNALLTQCILNGLPTVENTPPHMSRERKQSMRVINRIPNGAREIMSSERMSESGASIRSAFELLCSALEGQIASGVVTPCIVRGVVAHHIHLAIIPTRILRVLQSNTLGIDEKNALKNKWFGASVAAQMDFSNVEKCILPIDPTISIAYEVSVSTDIEHDDATEVDVENGIELNIASTPTVERKRFTQLQSGAFDEFLCVSKVFVWANTAGTYGLREANWVNVQTASPCEERLGMNAQSAFSVRCGYRFREESIESGVVEYAMFGDDWMSVDMNELVKA